MKRTIDPPVVRRPLRTAWGDFTATRTRWTHAITFTFAVSVSLEQPAKAHRTFVRRLAQELQDHIWTVWGVEPDGNGHHLHAVVALPVGNNLSAAAIEQRITRADRRVGELRVQPFDPGRGWEHYVAKAPEPDINVGCPSYRCRRGGVCKVGRVSWW
jgi:hypothetical protein